MVLQLAGQQERATINQCTTSKPTKQIERESKPITASTLNQAAAMISMKSQSKEPKNQRSIEAERQEQPAETSDSEEEDRVLKTQRSQSRTATPKMSPQAIKARRRPPVDEAQGAGQLEEATWTSTQGRRPYHLAETPEEEAETQPMTTAWWRSMPTRAPNRADLTERSWETSKEAPQSPKRTMMAAKMTKRLRELPTPTPTSAMTRLLSSWICKKMNSPILSSKTTNKTLATIANPKMQASKEEGEDLHKEVAKEAPSLPTMPTKDQAEIDRWDTESQEGLNLSFEIWYSI